MKQVSARSRDLHSTTSSNFNSPILDSPRRRFVPVAGSTDREILDSPDGCERRPCHETIHQVICQLNVQLPPSQPPRAGELPRRFWRNESARRRGRKWRRTLQTTSPERSHHRRRILWGCNPLFFFLRERWARPLSSDGGPLLAAELQNKEEM